MDYNYNRKLEINEWIITTRWFYMVAVFLIGILGNSLISLFSIKSSFFALGILVLFFLIINAYFYHYLSEIKKSGSKQKLKLLSVWQIVVELIIFTVILHLMGDKPLASVFYFLPIISSSIIFGVRGALLTAVISAALVNGSFVIDYFNEIFYFIFKNKNLSVSEMLELRAGGFDMIKILVTSNFYLVIAVVSGYSSKLLLSREQRLIKQTEKLIYEKKQGEKQTEKIDQSAKILAKHDLLLTKINSQLNKKIKQLENSEKSLFRAFSDLQAARKQADKERDKTSAIIANFVDPIIVIDKESKLNLINPAAKQFFGFIDGDLGKKVSNENNYSMENFKGLIKQKFSVKKGKNKKVSPNEEEVIVGFANQELTFKVITAEVADNKNEYLGVMKIFYNLTREKMIDKMKSDFISIAAHQLRTPLSAVKWVIKMVLDGDVGKLNKEQEKILFKGYQSNERIINLVNDMLNVSRIEEGRFGYEFRKEDFEQVLNVVVESLENQISERHIKYVLNKPEKLPKIYFDKDKMNLVLQNLLENAVKYTPEFGKIEVSLEFGNEFLKVKIKDNGVGIPEKDQKKLFSKFFRADNVMRMQTEGSGLGLFIVKNVIRKHGGEITFDSKEGMGTEFVFTIPLKGLPLNTASA
ncbi:GHKL domain-containing protein [Candidatus Parcubacteria bacterium]|nr:GHKL domain-containing protein [Candidatus Parcubacteria bacterium]